MKLYGDSRSGNCDKVKFVMLYLGLDCEWIELDSLAGDTRTVEFLSINPMGQIPYLEIDGDRGLSQSNAIVRYLARDSKLIPSDDYLSAQVDSWMFWEANNYEYFIAGCIGHMTYMEQSKATRDPVRVERAEQSLDLLEERFYKNKWIVGDSISIADIVLLAYTRNAHRGGFDMTKRVNVRNWITEVENELGVQS